MGSFGVDKIISIDGGHKVVMKPWRDQWASGTEQVCRSWFHRPQMREKRKKLVEVSSEPGFWEFIKKREVHERWAKLPPQ